MQSNSDKYFYSYFSCGKMHLLKIGVSCAEQCIEQICNNEGLSFKDENGCH